MTEQGTVLEVRRARRDDIAAITNIFNEAILTTTAVFYTEPRTVEQQTEWFDSHGPRYPVLVAEVDGQVVGWAALSAWSDRQAYDGTAETTCYVKSEYRGQGVGRGLKAALVAEARALRFHTLIARVAEESGASLHINQAAGFRCVGTLKEVGRKFGKLLDVHILQLMLNERPEDAAD